MTSPDHAPTPDNWFDILLDVQTRLVHLDTKIEDYKEIRDNANDALALAHKNEEDLEDLKDTVRWGHRTSIGAIFAAVVGIFLGPLS